MTLAPSDQIVFRVLGALDLRRGDAEVRSVLAQPKRVALLAYLALEGAGGYVQRDALLALFWPDAGEDKARSSLRSALYNLRSSLGETNVVTRGAAEIALSPDVQCDGVAFLHAVRERRWADVSRLYAGPVLPGFQPAGSNEFEQWLDGKRRSFADAAFGAALALGDEAQQAQDVERAAGCFERALAIRPAEEGVLRRLLDLLATSGQSTAAIARYEVWRRNLRETLDLEPSQETIDLVETMRSPAQRPAPTRVVLEPAAPETVAAPSKPSFARGLRLLVPLAVVALLLTALLPVFRARSGERAAPLVITAFEFEGDDAHAYLADVVPMLIRRQMATPLRALNGSVNVDGPELRITARVRTDKKTYKTTRTGDVANVLQMVEEVTAALANDASGALQAPAPRLTSSVGALLPFARAEADRNAGRFAAAARGYQAAVLLDSTFAWAHYRLSTVQEWMGMADEPRATADRALAMSHRLSTLEQRQLDAWRAYLWGEIPAARSAYDALVLDIGDDAELWSRLGELRFHWGPLLGIPRADADTAFRRVIALQPDNTAALFHHLRFVSLNGEADRARELGTQILAAKPDDFERLEITTLLAVLNNDARVLAVVAPQIAALSSLSEGNLLAAIATSAPEPLVVRELIGTLPPAGGAPDRRVQRRIIRAQLAAAAGRFRAAYADLDTLALAFPERALEYRAFLALANPAGLSPTTARLLRDSIAGLRAPLRPIGARIDYAAEPGVYPPRRILLEALLSDAAGLPLDTAALINRLNGHGDLFGYRYVVDVRTLANKNPEGRLALLGYVVPEPDNTFPDRQSYVEAWRRWSRARVLLDIGRPEAVTWLSTFPDPACYDLPFLPMSHLLRAETQERAGHRTEALVNFRRAQQLWQGADSELAPLVRRASAGIDRLTR